MPNPLARKTIAKIELALEEGQTTAIIEIIQIIRELASRAFSISISDLSDLIGRDPTITEKVISAANTLGFNPSGSPISTISEAIHTVGYEKIRNLAISLMLAENAGLDLNSFEQREMAALSVCSGLLAHTLVSESDPSVDVELLFVCASLRNYGKLLMSSFFVEQYREARSLALEMDSDKAFREVFGLTPLALARHLLENTNLPRSIMASLREVPKETLDREPESDEERIVVIAELCANVCEITFDDTIGPDQFNDAIMGVIARFQRCFPVSLEAINLALISVDQSFCQLNRVLGHRDNPSSPAMKLRARVTGEHLAVPPPGSQILPKPKPKTFEELNEEEREEFAEKSFQQAISRIANKLVPGERVHVKEVYEIACKTIMEGLDLENCMAFVREDFDPEDLSARYGFGPLFEKVKNRPLISPKKKDVFSICLNRKEDILIQDPKAGKIESVIPEWIHSMGETSSFLVLPTLVSKSLFAILVGTVSHGRIITLEEGDLRRLRQIRLHLGTLQRMINENAVSAV